MNPKILAPAFAAALIVAGGASLPLTVGTDSGLTIVENAALAKKDKEKPEKASKRKDAEKRGVGQGKGKGAEKGKHDEKKGKK